MDTFSGGNVLANVVTFARAHKLLVLDCVDAVQTALSLFYHENPIRISESYQLYGSWNGSSGNTAPVPFGCVLREIGTNNYIFSFRGTKTSSEWVEDFDFDESLFWPRSTSYANITPEYIQDKGLIVHQGFQNIYKTMREQVFGLLDGIGQIDRLAISGHSLGAALAGLFTIDKLMSNEVQKPKYKSLFVTLFGAPNSISSPTRDLYAAKMAEQNGFSINFANEKDIVPAAGKGNYVPFPYAIQLEIPDEATQKAKYSIQGYSFEQHSWWLYRSAIETFLS